MSVANGQLANQTTFNTAFMSRTEDTDTIGNVALKGSDLTVYWGDQLTDGSWRITNNSGEFLIDKRIGGVWITQTEVGEGAYKLMEFISDAAYETKYGAPTGGEVYYNSTTGKSRIYDGVESVWVDVGKAIVGFQELPTGVVNGVNTTFDVSLQPIDDNSVSVYVDGVLRDNSEWTFTNPTLTFNSAPQPGQQVYVVYLTEGTPASPVVPSATQNVVYHEITIADETGKQLTLPTTPGTASKTVLDIIDGAPQHYGVDYTVSGNILSWNGFALDGILGVTDVLRITYFS